MDDFSMIFLMLSAELDGKKKKKRKHTEMRSRKKGSAVICCAAKKKTLEKISLTLCFLRARSVFLQHSGETPFCLQYIVTQKIYQAENEVWLSVLALLQTRTGTSVFFF